MWFTTKGGISVNFDHVVSMGVSEGARADLYVILAGEKRLDLASGSKEEMKDLKETIDRDLESQNL